MHFIAAQLTRAAAKEQLFRELVVWQARSSDTQTRLLKRARAVPFSRLKQPYFTWLKTENPQTAVAQYFVID